MTSLAGIRCSSVLTVATWEATSAVTQVTMLSRRQCVRSAVLYSSREAVLPVAMLALFIDMISWPMTAGDLSVRELGANYPELRRRSNTRRSSLVTLARPPTSSSLRITDRSFQYASPCVWNQLPSSLPSTPFRSLCLWLACSCPYHIFSRCRLTTFTIHNSLCLLLP